MAGIEDTCTESGAPRDLHVEADPVMATPEGQEADPWHALIIGLKQAGAEGNLKRAECEVAWANKWLEWLEAQARERAPEQKRKKKQEPEQAGVWRSAPPRVLANRTKLT